MLNLEAADRHYVLDCMARRQLPRRNRPECRHSEFRAFLRQVVRQLRLVREELNRERGHPR